MFITDEEDISENDSDDDSGDLFKAFVKLIGREICRNKKPVILKFFNETKPLFGKNMYLFLYLSIVRRNITSLYYFLLLFFSCSKQTPL